MADERANAYWEMVDEAGQETERAVLRASSLGVDCEASLVRALVGQPGEGAPAHIQRAFDHGRAGEARVLEVLERDYGWKMVKPDTLGLWGPVGADGQVETELKVGKHVVRCHPDGVVVRVAHESDAPAWATIGKFAVVEAKLLSQGMYEKWRKVGLDVLSVYPWQVSVEMLTTQLPCIYVVGVKDENGELIDDEVHVRYYTEPPVSKAEIVKRVVRVVQAAKAHEAGGDMIPCPEKGQYPCPYYRMSDTVCGTAAERKREAGDGLDEETRDKIIHWSQFYLTGQTIRDSGARKMEQAKKELLGLVGESVTVGEYELVYRKGSVGAVSWKAVAEEMARDNEVDETAWVAMQDEHRGKPGEPSVSVKLTERKT